MEPTPEKLREEAALVRRLREGLFDFRSRQDLEEYASELERKAREMEAATRVAMVSQVRGVEREE